MAVVALWSGLFAGLVAICVTRAVEVLGPVRGGILGTLPTTAVPAALGLALRALEPDGSGLPGLTQALFSIPPGMLVNSFFLLAWRYWPSRLPPHFSFWQRLLAQVGISLGVWAVGAGIIVLLSRSLLTSVTSVVVFGCLCTVGLAAVGVYATALPRYLPRVLAQLRGTAPAVTLPPPPPHVAKPVKPVVLAARGVMACAAIGGAVSLSKVHEVVAGFTSTFPAIFLTTMVALWISQGEALPASTVGPMCLGSLSVPAYAISFAVYANGGLDVGLTAAAAWFTAVCLTSIPISALMRRVKALADADAAEAAAAAAAAGEAAAAGAAAPAAPAEAAPSAKGEAVSKGETAAPEETAWAVPGALATSAKLSV